MTTQARAIIEVCSNRLLAVLVTATLLHSQMAFAATCDLPMFAGARMFGAGGESQMLVTADFNHDGIADLAVINVGSNNVSILLGNGDGTLRNALTYGAGGSPLGMTVGDLNGDGKPDLVMVDDIANSLQVMLNNYIPGSSASACTATQVLSN
jgi:hypothetical protein